MATNFPASLDSLTNPVGSDTLAAPDHAVQHTNINDAVEALQTTVGIDGSSDANSLDYKVSKRLVVTNAQTTTAYTLALADMGKLVEMSNAVGNSLTVPPNSSVAFPVGTVIDVLQTGAGQTSLVAGSGVTVDSAIGLKFRARWSAVTLIKRATDTWVAIGDLSA